jgi:putative RecB family exonuclease
MDERNADAPTTPTPLGVVPPTAVTGSTAVPDVAGSGASPDEPSDEPIVDADGALRLLDLDAAPPGTYGELEPESPPLIDGQGRVRLSFSRIDTYRTCPRQFRYAYVDRLPGVPSPNLSFGSSIHGALEAFYDRKLPACPSVEELLAALYATWDQSGFRALPREEQLAYYRHAQDVLRRFHQRAAPTYRLPVATEAWFELPIAYEAVVVGSIDRVDVDDDGDLHVIDYKTNRKAKPRERVAGSLQLAIYALACRHLYGVLPRTVSLDFVVPGVVVTVGLDELDLDAARQAILETAAAVRAEAYHPTPNRLCDWCDFRSICPAWEGDPSEALGPATRELQRLRRQVARDVRTLRELEAGVARLAAETAVRVPEGQPADPGAADPATRGPEGQPADPGAADPATRASAEQPADQESSAATPTAPTDRLPSLPD